MAGRPGGTRVELSDILVPTEPLAFQLYYVHKWPLVQIKRHMHPLLEIVLEAIGLELHATYVHLNTTIYLADRIAPQGW